MKAIGVIPARYASTRFPGKPLVEIAGRSMIEHVYRRASQALSLQSVWVATDASLLLHYSASGTLASGTTLPARADAMTVAMDDSVPCLAVWR